MYRRLAVEAPGVLRTGGLLLAEIGHDQHEQVLSIFQQAGGWSYVGSYRDPTDPYDRVVEFQNG